MYIHSVQVDIKLKHKLYLCKIPTKTSFGSKTISLPSVCSWNDWLTDARSNSDGLLLKKKKPIKCYRTVTVWIIKQMRDSWHLFQNGLSAVVFCHYAKWWGPHCDREVEANPLKLNIFCVSPCRRDFWVSWLQLFYW